MVMHINGLYLRGHHHLIEPTGSSYLLDRFGDLCSGAYVDLERYPMIHQEEENTTVLWKCQACGKVHRMEDTLECDGCGQPITEKSRFILE